MKELKKISLFNLSQAELTKKEQNALRGGNDCYCICVTSCPCKYAGEQEGPDDSYYGGSSTEDNGKANAESQGASPRDNAMY